MWKSCWKKSWNQMFQKTEMWSVIATIGSFSILKLGWNTTEMAIKGPIVHTLLLIHRLQLELVQDLNFRLGIFFSYLLPNLSRKPQLKHNFYFHTFWPLWSVKYFILQKVAQLLSTLLTIFKVLRILKRDYKRTRNQRPLAVFF